MAIPYIDEIFSNGKKETENQSINQLKPSFQYLNTLINLGFRDKKTA